MVQAGFLASTVLMGVLTAAVVIALANGREWRHYAPANLPATTGGGSDEEHTGLWALGFVLLVLAVGGMVVLLVGGFGSLTASAPTIGTGTAVIALFVVLIAGYAVAWSYATARSHGAGTAQAAMVGIWALGLLFVAAVVAQLFLG
jgi:hypothetical protein